MKTLFIFIVFLSFYALPQNKWLKLNGPEGGVMQGIIVKGDTIIAGSAYQMASAFYSFDKGQSWKQSKTKLKDRFSEFCFTDDGGIIAANPSYGLYKSYDFINWTRLYVNGLFWSLANDKQGKIYAGTDQGDIFTSQDNGLNWIRELKVGGRINKFYLSPYDKLFAGGDGKIMVKDLSSSIWSIQYTDSTNGAFRIIEGPSDKLFAATGSSIRISIDSGRTWQKQSTGTFFTGELMLDFIYNHRVIGAFGDETQWSGVGWGAAVSNNQGVTWEWSQTGLPPKISGSRLTKSGTDTYMSTWGAGVYKSTDYGGSWFAVNNGIYAALVVGIHIDNEGTLYSAAWGSGLSKSTDLGKSWMVINNGLDNVYFYSIISDDDGILYAGSERGTFRSDDKGENWIKVSPVWAYHLIKDNKNRIYALCYGQGLLRTTDQGNSWIRIDKNFNSGYIFGFAIDSSDNIYAGGRGGGAIYKSTDDGDSWSKVYQGISSAVLTGISISPNGNLFAAIINEGILRSTDYGQSWEKKNSGLPGTNVNPLAINQKGEVYTALYMQEGIYVSRDDGDSWQNISSNINLTEVYEFLFHDEEIYLATDESVWKSNPDSLTSVAEDDVKPKKYFLSQNYPNPFNPFTTIKYSLAQTGRVALSIFDLLGREVIKLLDEEKPAGEYETTWNASSYPSGIYFMKMQAGQFNETRKVVLMK